MSSSDCDDVYSSCVRKQFTAAKLKQFADFVIHNELDNDENETDAILKNERAGHIKQRGQRGSNGRKPVKPAVCHDNVEGDCRIVVEKAARTTRSQTKLRKQQEKPNKIDNTFQQSSKNDANDEVIILDDSESDDGCQDIFCQSGDEHMEETDSSMLSEDNCPNTPTSPPAVPSDGRIQKQRKRMKRDVREVFMRLQKVQSEYRKEDLDVSIIDVSPVKEQTNTKEISVKIRCHLIIHKYTMKMTDSFKNVYENLAKQENISENLLKMFLNERRVRPYDTPASIGLQVADIIECYVRNSNETGNEDESFLDEPDTISLVLQASNSRSRMKLKIRKSEPFERIMKEYCHRQDLSYEKTTFQFDGEVIHSYDTASSVGLEEGECIDVIES